MGWMICRRYDAVPVIGFMYDNAGNAVSGIIVVKSGSCYADARDCQRSIVWVRSGPTDTMAIGVLSSFSRNAM